MKLTADWLKHEPTQAICRVLMQAGHQALFVGGCVRNSLLGEPVGDIDITTDARPEAVVKLMGAAGLKLVPTGLEHGTVTVISDGMPHEVTTFREDVETDGRHAVIAYATDVTHDARRRDFTMNALYARPDGTVLDPLGGLPDLQARHVRFIEDPGRRIREDYLRILRFFRFHAWYGDAQNGLDSDGLAAVAAHVGGLAGLSRERVGSEVIKLLAAPDPTPTVAAMRQAGVLAAILPGADDSALAILVHLEAESGIAPDSLRRLAAIGGQDVADRLRLSKVQARRLALLKAGAAEEVQATELGYRHGCETGFDILLLRAALSSGRIAPDAVELLQKGATAGFPVSARDLMPEYSGPQLGERLKDLERLWIGSDFTLTREELLRAAPSDRSE